MYCLPIAAALGVSKPTLFPPRKIEYRDKRPSGVMRESANSNLPFALISITVPKRNPEPPSSTPVTESLRPRGGIIPEMKEGGIEYVGRREPRVPLPILLLGLVAVAAAIIAFLHFSRP
jgi:hypothetical protein